MPSKWPRVILALPIPDPNQQHFGPIKPGGRSLNFTSDADRLVAAKWAVDMAVGNASLSEGVLCELSYPFYKSP